MNYDVIAAVCLCMTFVSCSSSEQLRTVYICSHSVVRLGSEAVTWSRATSDIPVKDLNPILRPTHSLPMMSHWFP